MDFQILPEVKTSDPVRYTPPAMTRTIHAIYEHGVLRPLESVDLQEGAEVEIEIRAVNSTKGPWTRFVERIEPLTDEEYEAIKREAARRPLFETDDV